MRLQAIRFILYLNVNVWDIVFNIVQSIEYVHYFLNPEILLRHVKSVYVSSELEEFSCLNSI